MSNNFSRATSCEYFFRLCLALSLAVASWAVLAGSALAQQAGSVPDRGINPIGSYSASDIETISLTNGNLNLSIPLASMPPVSGGKLSWALRATYNSKLWDRISTEHPPNPPIGGYLTHALQLSTIGGWGIATPYQINVVSVLDEYHGYLPSDSSDPEYFLTGYQWKMMLTTPDGAKHELRPLDYSSYPGSLDWHRGYYKDTPRADSINASMRYYSFDGSYIWAKIDPYPIGGGPETWIVYLPDGTKIEQQDIGLQVVTDTNGNSIYSYTFFSGSIITTRYIDGNSGRYIQYVYNSATNTGQVQYQSVGGTWISVDVNMGTTHVQGLLYPNSDLCPQNQLVDTEIPVIRSIVLPQTKSGAPRLQFTFNYNSDTTDTGLSMAYVPYCAAPGQTITSASHGWGELSQMITPLGATANYTYSQTGVHQLVDSQDAPRESVATKTLNHDSTTDTWTYVVDGVGGSVTAPDGSVTTEDRYTSDQGFTGLLGGALGKAGLVYRTNRSNKVIVERHWTKLLFNGLNDAVPGGLAVANPVVDVEYTTLKEGASLIKMSAKTFQYDYNGNVTQEADYDWFDPSLVSRDAQGVPTGVPGGLTPLRVITNTYYNPATISTSTNVYAKRALLNGTPLILNALKETITGTSDTQFSYDSQAYGTAPTIGNLTKVSRWDSVNSKWIDTTYTYDGYGNKASTTEPNGSSSYAGGTVTSYFYDDSTHALPTRVVVDPLNGTGQQTTTTVYDYYTGRVTNQTDPNSQTTTIDYTNQLLGTVDPYMRPGIVTGPALTSVVNGVSYANQHHKTKTSYDDNLRQVTVESDLNTEGDYKLKTRTTQDQLGRAILTENNEDGTGNYTISSQMGYVQMGKITLASQSRRSAAANTDGWMRTTRDEIGRVSEIATFAGASQPPTSGTNSNWTGSVATAYYANQTTVTDQTSKARRSFVDGIGRLAQVIEDPSGLAYQTNYNYDSRGNLTTVTQGSQTRNFSYNSLNLLTSATNPESGTISYTYYDNGNLKQKTDARPVTATYTYDGLNRNTGISYSDSTPVVERVYDGPVSNGKGRLYYHVSYNLHPVQPAPNNYAYSRLVIGGYDAVGRVTSQSQGFANTSGTAWSDYQVSQGYNLAGVTLQTYPSGRIVNYNYDNAGRLSSFSGNIGDGTPRTYADAVTYNANGQMAKERFGTNNLLYHNMLYNSRLQMIENRLGTVSADPTTWNRGALIFYYSVQARTAYNQWLIAPDNNGNVTRAEHYVPTADIPDPSSNYAVSQRDSYEYDGLNRIQSMTEDQRNSGGTWTNGVTSQNYTYDRWGNRTAVSGSNPQSYNTTEASATNRLKLTSGNQCTGTKNGFCYDAVGNLTFDNVTGTGNRTYDGENRMISAAGSGINYYLYDADGRRVRRIVGAQEWWQVYGMDGELVAEYLANALPATTSKEYGYRNGQILVVGGCDTMRWLVADQVGTPRMEADVTGSLSSVRRHDYYPFGEENFAGVSIRTAANGYQADCVRQKFGSKERDIETGLDYFGARYLASAQGRFTSPDEPFADQHEYDTQSWNLYSYVVNNPLRFTDPTGRAKGCKPGEVGPCVGEYDTERYTFIENGRKKALYWNNAGGFWETRLEMMQRTTGRGIKMNPASGLVIIIPAAAAMNMGLGTLSVGAIGREVLRQTQTGSQTNSPQVQNDKLPWDQWAGRLREAARTKGNSGMGEATRDEADALGKAWVGPGYRTASDGKTLISSDGLKIYRPPSFKPYQGKEQANFEWRISPGGKPTGNAHLDIK